MFASSESTLELIMASPNVSVTRDMYRQFAAAAVDSRHLINESDSDPATLAELIDGQLAGGTFRYSPN